MRKAFPIVLLFMAFIAPLRAQKDSTIIILERSWYTKPVQLDSAYRYYNVIFDTTEGDKKGLAGYKAGIEKTTVKWKKVKSKDQLNDHYEMFPASGYSYLIAANFDLCENFFIYREYSVHPKAIYSYDFKELYPGAAYDLEPYIWDLMGRFEKRLIYAKGCINDSVHVEIYVDGKKIAGPLSYVPEVRLMGNFNCDSMPDFILFGSEIKPRVYWSNKEGYSTIGFKYIGSDFWEF